MARFFEYGEVESVCSDNTTRQVAVKVSAPWCVVQASLAIFLGHGSMDMFSVRQPLAAWIPALPRKHFSDASIVAVPDISEKVWAVVKERTTEMLELFSEVSSILKNPDDAIGLLPMSIYVTFQFRSTYEGLAEVIQKLEPLGTPGISEFRYAMASVLAELLVDSGDVKSDIQNIPPMFGTFADRDLSDLALPALPAQGQDSFSQNGRK